MVKTAHNGKFTWEKFGQSIGKSKSAISQYKNNLPISNNVVKDIEAKYELDPGFMDNPSNIIGASKYKEFLAAVMKIALENSEKNNIQFDPEKLSDFIVDTYSDLSSNGKDMNFIINPKIIKSLMLSYF